MKVEDFEVAVRDVERVTLIVRAPESAEIGDYNYQRMISGGKTITEWKRSRLKGLLGNYEYVILDADRETPNGRTLMSTLRDSYE